MGCLTPHPPARGANLLGTKGALRSLAPTLRGRLMAALLASVTVASLSGCGGSGAPGTQASLTSTEAESAAEPFTTHQQLIAQGAHLIVSDGCAACHLMRAGHGVGPSLASFAGHDVTLASGRRVLVDERFLRDALRNPRKDAIAGYNPAPMIRAAERLRLSSRPQQIAALAAFIEQIGPEPG
jgi:Cytochrome c